MTHFRRFLLGRFSVRLETIRCAIAAASLVSLGCSGSSGSEAEQTEQTGVARVSLTNAPSDALCLQITVSGVRTVQRSFDLSPGARSVFMLRELPLGTDTFTGLAYGTGCGSVDASTDPTWQSDSVATSVSLHSIANVSLIMRRTSGQASVSVDFQDEDGGGVPAPSYTITDLGTLPGDVVSYLPTDINNHNEVVGYSFDSTETPHPFIWRDGTLQDLACCGADVPSSASAINDDGVAVCSCRSVTGTWHDGTTTILPIIFPYDINGDGWIAGGNACGAPYEAYVYDGVSATDLSLGGSCAGSRGINASGTVVGGSWVPDNSANHPFVSYDRGSAQDLGTLGGNDGNALAINDAGDIVGNAQDVNGAWHLVMWPNGGTITDLGLLNFIPGTSEELMKINSGRRIVGHVDGHAFLWVPPGTMYDLNDLIPAGSGWVLDEARSINDQSFIVGSGNINGEEHGFLLTPR